ncbi:MAG: hypothetical protein D6704_05015 [Nitrospirae bacterium]|nr:MAG: hypothetical protein D6704_05015 [Nitrospirota bacterium]
MSDWKILGIKNLGPKVLAWLRQHYPPDHPVSERIVIDDHQRGAHRYRVVQRGQKLVLQRDDGAYAMIYDAQIGIVPSTPEEAL